MRILGELLVILGLATVAMIYTMRRHVGPALQRRRIEQLERENAELDEQLARFRGERDRSGGASK